jgi:hypothetical protein
VSATIVDRYVAELGELLAHRIRITTGSDPRTGRRGNALLVSCSCREAVRWGRPRYSPIEARTRFPAADAIAAWRAWHEQQGVIV